MGAPLGSPGPPRFGALVSRFWPFGARFAPVWRVVVFSVCSRCERLFPRGSLTVRAKDGLGHRWVDGPPGPAGWRLPSERRRVSFPLAERLCDRCLGLPKPPLPPEAGPAWAGASGFRRFSPTSKEFATPAIVVAQPHSKRELWLWSHIG